MANLKIVLPGHPLRKSTEELVQKVYARQYGAKISSFPDTLVALVNGGGEPYCAAGLRIGLKDCFSELYLDDNIQNMFSKAVGERVNRKNILEVTNLASVRIGASFVLLREITAYGRERDMQFGVFTATNRLRQALHATRVQMFEFSPAWKSRVSNPDDWGSYYEHDPWVCGLADTFMRQTRSRLNIASYPPKPQLLVA